jgi:multidrug efflux system membrane fusion protein
MISSAKIGTFRRNPANVLRLLALPVMLLLTGCGKDAGGAAAAPATGGGGRGGGPVAVTTAPAVLKPMAVKVRAVGNVEASSTVEVRSQVSGELLKVGFIEGRDVTEGDLLFTIDPRTFESTLKAAQATLARDQATAQNLAAQKTRQDNLLKSGLLSRADYDAMIAQVNAMDATLAADAAAVESAKIQLQNTQIKAPVSGRTGALLVHQDRSCAPNDTTCARRHQSDHAGAGQFRRSRAPAAENPQRRRPRTRRLGLAERIRTRSRRPAFVAFIDNAVDTSTDTIRLKATFPNTDHKLWPGAFVEVSLQLSVDPQAVVVPTAAVQASQQGQYVFVVKADQTVDSRPVTIAWIDGDDTVIATGLKGGETVVT